MQNVFFKDEEIFIFGLHVDRFKGRIWMQYQPDVE